MIQRTTPRNLSQAASDFMRFWLPDARQLRWQRAEWERRAAKGNDPPAAWWHKLERHEQAQERFWTMWATLTEEQMNEIAEVIYGGDDE